MTTGTGCRRGEKARKSGRVFFLCFLCLLSGCSRNSGILQVRLNNHPIEARCLVELAGQGEVVHQSNATPFPMTKRNQRACLHVTRVPHLPATWCAATLLPDEPLLLHCCISSYVYISCGASEPPLPERFIFSRSQQKRESVCEIQIEP